MKQKKREEKQTEAPEAMEPRQTSIQNPDISETLKQAEENLQNPQIPISRGELFREVFREGYTQNQVIRNVKYFHQRFGDICPICGETDCSWWEHQKGNR